MKIKDPVLLLTVLLSVVGETAPAQDVPAADNPYGACAHITRFRRARNHEWQERAWTCATLADTGVGWVRSDFDSLVLDSTSHDGLSLQERYDDLLRTAETNGVQIFPILCVPGGRAITDPVKFSEWTNNLARVVTRYGNRLPVWEIINEPDWRTNKFTGAEYVRHLRAAADTIRSSNPDVRIACGGWANFVHLATARDAYALGAGDLVDIHNFHCYAYPNPPEPKSLKRLEDFRALLSKNNCDNKPIWITECGWPTAQGDRRSTTEECAARWLPRGHLTFFAAGVEKVFVYEWRAPENTPHEREDHFGLHHWDFKPKPSVLALRTLIEERPAGSVQLFDRPWRNTTNHTATIFWPQWRRPSGETAGAIWCHETVTNGPALHVAFDAAPTFRDYLGKSVTLTPESDGSYRIPRSPDVLYFRGANLTALTIPKP